MNQRITDMLELQYILEKQYQFLNLSESITELQLEMVTEMGELLQATKGIWCKRIRHDIPYDKKHTLEELADCIHFALASVLEMNQQLHMDWFEYPIDAQFELQHKKGINDLIEMYINQEYGCLAAIFLIGDKFGFTFEEMYEAYKNKNKINLQRLKDGY